MPVKGCEKNTGFYLIGEFANSTGANPVASLLLFLLLRA